MLFFAHQYDSYIYCSATSTLKYLREIGWGSSAGSRIIIENVIGSKWQFGPDYASIWHQNKLNKETGFMIGDKQ